ncbi:PREDICTED: melanoma-associated antigen 10-like [Myotis davidii]|uniref:melanoma-associated antigen 10-like n=1 Tax=Myotis davidii TaxID=225400 RepID=UPI0003EC455B|nr:PREDICTED: melanoma-associated antigen 10-like [Myotis davidii]
MAAPTWSQSEDEGVSSQDEQETNSREHSEGSESALHDALYLKMTELVEFLLPKYREKQPTTKAEMLSKVIKEYEDQFPEIFSLASEFMQLLFGIDVEEVDPSSHTYALVTTLGLTYQQVPNSDPARYQFLWGPRAHAETTKLKVRETFLRDYRKDPSYVPYLSEEATSDEEEGA